MARASIVTSAPVASHTSAIALMNEIFVARNALAATFTSSAVAKSVTTTGTSRSSVSARSNTPMCADERLPGEVGRQVADRTLHVGQVGVHPIGPLRGTDADEVDVAERRDLVVGGEIGRASCRERV